MEGAQIKGGVTFVSLQISTVQVIEKMLHFPGVTSAPKKKGQASSASLCLEFLSLQTIQEAV